MGATTALTIKHESTKEKDKNGEEDMDAEDAEGEEESTRSPPKKAKKAHVSKCDGPRSSWKHKENKKGGSSDVPKRPLASRPGAPRIVPGRPSRRAA